MRLIYVILIVLCCPPLFAQDLAQITQQKPVTISGGIDLRGIAYSATGIAPRRNPFSYIISGNTNIGLYSINIPLSFTLSEQDRSFSQPFNQFGLSPTYKWLTLHFGYRNLSFSPYTLDGHTMLGTGFELNPGKFHVAVMYGRLNRATTVDTAFGTLQPFSFSRKGLAVKMGIGDEKSYFTVSVLNAKDDSSSVSVNPATKSIVQPSANTVASMAWRVQFAGKLFIEADGGASLWTDDIGSKLNVTDSSAWVSTARKVMPINGSTSFYLAGRAATGFTSRVFSLKLEYKYVDPQFRSMGVYYFNNDVKNYTISPSLNLFKNKLRLFGSIGRQEDNVRQQKQATTARTIGMANLSLDVTRRFGFDAGFTNFSSNSRPSVVLVQNKYLLANSNSNISFTPRYIYSNPKYSHIIIASYNRSNLTDDNAVTQTTNNITTEIMLLNYTCTIIKRGLSITGGFTKATNTLATGNFNNQSYTASLNKNWLKGKLLASLSNTYTVSKGPSGQVNIYNMMLNGVYQPSRHHRLNIRYNMLNNKPAAANGTQLKFLENTSELGYTLSF